MGDRSRSLDQRARTDRIDAVAIEPLGVERGIDLARQRDRDVEPFAQPRHGMPRSIDVEVKLGMLRAQIGEPGKEALRGVERRSEEHTSELQSLMRTSYAVFCLKKKKDK